MDIITIDCGGSTLYPEVIHSAARGVENDSHLILFGSRDQWAAYLRMLDTTHNTYAAFNILFHFIIDIDMPQDQLEVWKIVGRTPIQLAVIKNLASLPPYRPQGH